MAAVDTEKDLPEETYDDPKKQDPLSALPKSSMNLVSCKDSFFRAHKANNTFFNEEFWKQFDSTGFSVHHGTYRYNSDLAELADFVQRNRVAGITREMDSTLAHKYLFGVFKLFGNTLGETELEVLFITRGQELHRDVFGEPLEYFEWNILNNTDQDVRTHVSKFFHTNISDKVGEKTVKHNAFFV